MPGGGTILLSTDQVEVETAVQRGHEVMPAGKYIRINVADTGPVSPGEYQSYL